MRHPTFLGTDLDSSSPPPLHSFFPGSIMFATATAPLSSRETPRWGHSFVLCLALGIVIAPLADACLADNATCLAWGSAGCQLTAQAATAPLTDAANLALQANQAVRIKIRT